MERWALTAHLRAAVSCNFKDLLGVNNNSDEKKLSSKTRDRKSFLSPGLNTPSPLMLI